MTPERYSQVKSLFQLVLEQQPAQRPAFLERACGADRDLYNQVRELLQSDSTSENFLEKPAVTPLSKVLADAAADVHEAMPNHIGPYALQKLLGSGGMGAVYLAARADKTFHKQVAIKVIHKGMHSERILQRFRRERQIVASLDHPNIARLLDGGATEDGRPYIVMEYVEGMAIDTWCDQRKLNTEQRLRLFLQVCDAIHYAHQNLIIHRDIKPGNILVRPDNTVKLLDFGIAKLMNPDVSAAPEKTATSMRLMTPQYASPEQIKGEAITTATDVYLLGIVLYEMLTGHRPYQLKDDAPLEAVRAFAQNEPQRPSEAIFRTAERLLPNGQRQVTRNAIIVSQVRDGTAAALHKRLQGDIDAILLRALRRNPAERYQSTAQLAEDIRNHLGSLPISALPDNAVYRIRLFLRRNRGASLAATGIVTVLLLITVFALWHAYRANAEHQRAQARFSEVRKMSNALLFDLQDTLAPLPGTTPARRILVNKTLEYLTNLAKDTSGDTGLQRELAAGYLRVGHLQGNPNYANLGDTAGALASYRRSQTILEQLHRSEPRDNEIANDLAGSSEALADMLTLNGDSANALATLRHAVELRDSANASPELKAASYHNLAVALATAGSHDQALSLAKKARQIAASLTGTEAPRHQALSHTRLATVLERSGDLSRAAESYRAALTIYEQLAAANPVAARPKRELSFALENLADLETRTGQSAKAAPLYQRSIHLRRDLSAADPQNFQARRDLAYALLKHGSIEDALESFRQLATMDPANILARQDLALAWERQGNLQLAASKPDAALQSYRQLLQTAREWIQRDPANPYANQMLAVGQMKVAEVLPKTGDREGAISSARSAIRVVDALLEKDKDNALFLRTRALAQWVLGRSLAETAAATKKREDWKAAESELERARVLFTALATRKQLTAEDANTLPAITNQIEACRRAGTQ